MRNIYGDGRLKQVVTIGYPPEKHFFPIGIIVEASLSRFPKLFIDYKMKKKIAEGTEYP